MMKLFPEFGVLLTWGSVTIRMYAIMILTGALIAYALGRYRFRQLDYDPEILSDYFFGVLFSGIIGARIWYVIFSWQELYAGHPEEIIAIWHGGLAIQGGLIVGVIYSLLFFKKREIPFLVAGDAIMPGVLIAQACGRWGNFFNQEAYGGIVSRAFLERWHIPGWIIDKMYIGTAYHHPTFLYESIGNVLAFLVIVLIIRRFARRNGTQFFSYFIAYGLVRIPVEALRTDSLMLGSFKMAQLTSVLFITFGIAGLIYLHFKGILRKTV